MADTAVGGDIITSNFPVGSRFDLAVFQGNSFGQIPTRFNINIDGRYMLTDPFGNSTTDFLMQGFVCYDKVMRIVKDTGLPVDAGSVTVVF